MVCNPHLFVFKINSFLVTKRYTENDRRSIPRIRLVALSFSFKALRTRWSRLRNLRWWSRRSKRRVCLWPTLNMKAKDMVSWKDKRHVYTREQPPLNSMCLYVGFRRAENIKRTLDLKLWFYGQIFGFPVEGVEGIKIYNYHKGSNL